MKLGIYDRTDFDGKACGALLREMGCQTLPYNYGDKLPLLSGLTGYQELWICDTCLPDDMMLDLAAIYGSRFHWVDHHKCAFLKLGEQIRKLRGIVHYSPDDAACYGLAEIEGMLLTGHTNLEWLSDYDTWKLGSGNYVLGHQTQANRMWGCLTAEQLVHSDSFLGWLRAPVDSDFVAKGRNLVNYNLQQYRALIAAYGYAVNFQNLDALAINTPLVDSYMFESVRDNYEICIAYYWNAERDSWKYSIRSNNIGVDCGFIADNYGGGGHKGAAGFSTKKLIL